MLVNEFIHDTTVVQNLKLKMRKAVFAKKYSRRAGLLSLSEGEEELSVLTDRVENHVDAKPKPVVNRLSLQPKSWTNNHTYFL